jgi:hypothetical protein
MSPKAVLEGFYIWLEQGFLEADPYAIPASPPWTAAELPPTGLPLPPTFFFAIRPAQQLKSPTTSTGYYPYAAAGVVEFKTDLTWTASVRVNIGGNSLPYQQDQLFEGTLIVYPDLRRALMVSLDANNKNDAEWYLLLDESRTEILTMTTFSGSHRRGVATGRMRPTVK